MSKSKAVTKSVNFPAYNLSTRKPDSMVVTDVIHIKSYKKEKDGSRKATGNFRYVIKGTGLNKTGAHLQMSAITNKDEAERISKLLRKDAKIEEPKTPSPPAALERRSRSPPSPRLAELEARFLASLAEANDCRRLADLEQQRQGRDRWSRSPPSPRLAELEARYSATMAETLRRLAELEQQRQERRSRSPSAALEPLDWRTWTPAWRRPEQLWPDGPVKSPSPGQRMKKF